MKKLITIRIDDKIYNEYQDYLKENGMCLSKRVRNFINSDLKKLKTKK